MWAVLPDVLLEDIFSRLDFKERNAASQVCYNWYRIFQSPHIWSRVVVDDLTLTRRKFNYSNLDDQYVLSHYRMNIFLNKMGFHLRHIKIAPMTNLHNLYEFVRMMTCFDKFYGDESPVSQIKSFEFTFACDMAQKANTEDCIFGTGGEILRALKDLLTHLTGLQRLTLRNLLLDATDAQYLLDDVASNCCEAMRVIKITNCTKQPYPLLHVGCFLNITTVVISPQQLNDDVVGLLSQTKLENLWIVQTKYTENAVSVSKKAWREARLKTPRLRVHLAISGKGKAEVIWQENAPVKSILYDSPYARIKAESILMSVSLYGADLEEYSFHGLPRFFVPKSFKDRADSALLLLCRNCLNLKTLIIRERVSTSTLLLIAVTGQSLTRLIVRRNAVVLRCEWNQEEETWSDHFYAWLKASSASYEATAREVTRILGNKWHFLSDEDFKRVRPKTSF